MEITNDKGYVIAGYSFSSDGDVSGNYGDKDFWILKTDSAGNIQWEQNYGGSDKDWAYSIQQTLDSGYIVAGFSQSNDGDVTGNNGGNDYWILKLNSSGNIEWEQNYGGSKSDIANAINQTADGGYFVAGQSSTYNTGSIGVPDYWLLKLDSLGNIQWSQSYGGSGTDDPKSIQSTEDKSYVIAGGGASTDGDVKNNNGSKNTWVVKVDSMGKILWENSYEGGNATSIKKTKDGGFILTGRVRGNNNTFECLVLKIDSSGKLEWKKKYGGSDYDSGIDVYQKSNGKFILAGLSMSSDGDVPDNKGNGDSWVIILDSLGNIEWSKNYGGSVVSGRVSNI